MKDSPEGTLQSKDSIPGGDGPSNVIKMLESIEDVLQLKHQKGEDRSTRKTNLKNNVKDEA